jgi:hypothetical protein
MLTEYEAQKLQRDMHEELDGATGALLKSAIGLLIILALALFGAPLDVPDDAALAQPQPGTQAAVEEQRPE